MTLITTGHLEAMTRPELERAYRFAAGALAPPLPDDPSHAARVVLRHLARLGQPGPAQGETTMTGRMRLPFRGFIRRPAPGTLGRRILIELRTRPRRIGDLAHDLGLEFVSVLHVLRILNEWCGYAVVEDPETRTVTIHARPLRP